MQRCRGLMPSSILLPRLRSRRRNTQNAPRGKETEPAGAELSVQATDFFTHLFLASLTINNGLPDSASGSCDQNDDAFRHFWRVRRGPVGRSYKIGLLNTSDFR